MRASQRYGAQLVVALNDDDPEIAKDAYLRAKALPSFTTQARLEGLGLKLTVPLETGSALTVCYRRMRAFVLKPLDAKEAARIGRLQAAMEGRPVPGVTEFELFESPHAGSDKHFMTMPKYDSTLEPVQPLEPEDAMRFWLQMRGALQGLHALGFAHNDVKPANICVVAGVDFVLVDLASCARFGERSASTPAYVPRDLEERAAAPVVDWWMLAMTLAEACCGESGMQVGAGARSASKEELRDHLMGRLVRKAIWDELSPFII